MGRCGRDVFPMVVVTPKLSSFPRRCCRYLPARITKSPNIAPSTAAASDLLMIFSEPFAESPGLGSGGATLDLAIATSGHAVSRGPLPRAHSSVLWYRTRKT